MGARLKQEEHKEKNEGGDSRIQTYHRDKEETHVMVTRRKLSKNPPRSCTVGLIRIGPT